ncbi:hypothetical protein LTR08_005072 [Meristemomyces frigidus]|nr:hypothetical protein LTR08_005072 [Meristemomyces frigidus]
MPDGHEKQLDDGWTHIGKCKGKAPVHVHGLNPQMRDATVEKIRAEFEIKMKRWRNSSCYQQVRQILDRQQPEGGWQIGDAVCLATGSFSRDNWQSRQRSLAQFVAFMAVIQHLQKTQSTKILCYAQEPCYTPLDRDFLASMGVTNLHHDVTSDDFGLGAAAEHLNASTFVFEPFMDLGVESMRALFGAGVRLYIGSSVQRWVDDIKKSAADIKVDIRRRRGVSDEGITADHIDQLKMQSKQAEQFVRSRRSYKFPRFEEDPNVFEGLTIFWKEAQDDEEG